MVLLHLLTFEIKDQLKSWVYWLLSWCAVSGILASVYQSFADEQAEFESAINSAPSQLLSTFNIQDNYLSSVETFASGQFLTFFTLVGCIYGAVYGSTLLGGKIRQKQIWQHLNLPITRSVLAGVYCLLAAILWLVMDLLVPLFMFALLSIFTEQADISLEFFLSMGVGSFLLHISFVYIGAFISLLTNQSTGSGVGAGLAAGTWFVNTIGKLDGVPEWIAQTSPFYYFDTAYLSQEFMLDWSLLLWLPVLALTALVLSVVRFRSMDIPL